MNKWKSTKEFSEKKKATQLIVNCFPQCKSAIMMTSTTCLDLEEMFKQNKIDTSTIIYDVDNLKSADLNVANKIDTFKNIVKKRFKEITGNDYLFNLNKNNFILGKNIQDIPLSCYVNELCPEGCDLIYADTCGIYKKDIINWIKKAPFLQSLKTNGIFALTVLLTRCRLEGNEEFPQSNPDVFLMGKNKKDTYLKKLNIIANEIEMETKQVLQTKALIHYSDTVKSPMGVIVCEKK